MVNKEEFTEKLLRMQEESKKRKKKNSERLVKDYISDSFKKRSKKWKKRFYH